MNHHRLKSHSFLSPVLLCSLVVVEGCIGDQANVVHVLWQDMIELLYISLKYRLKLGDCSFHCHWILLQSLSFIGLLPLMRRRSAQSVALIVAVEDCVDQVNADHWLRKIAGDCGAS
jgi:hypothetical protein